MVQRIIILWFQKSFEKFFYNLNTICKICVIICSEFKRLTLDLKGDLKMKTTETIIEGQKVELEIRGFNTKEQDLIEAFLATKVATQCEEQVVGNKRVDVKLTSSFLTTANTFNEQGLANPNPFWDEMARERDLETIREFNRGEISKDELAALLKGEVK